MKKGIVLFFILAMISIFIVSGLESKEIREKEQKIDNRIYEVFEEENFSKQYIIKYNDKNSFYLSDSKNKNFEVKNFTKEQLEYLKKQKEIEYIEEVRFFETFLQDSVNLTNVNLSWNLQNNFVNLTGLGQTICVIDTGIDFNHQNLQGKNLTCNIYCDPDGSDCYESCSITDLNGHGTHVAGIISSDDDLKGIAFDSKLIGVKVFSGSSRNDATTTSLINGINWCIDNFENYNISVISMSLGTDTRYNSYCDNSFITLSNSINEAYLKNISVVVATGNEADFYRISSPACIQNAIPITSTNKADDNISSFANTWNNTSLINLAAPGEDINSTYLSNSYDSLDGTSMSTPHVSGAIAIINQFLKSRNRTMTPTEIENLLNSTGKQIYDSFANRNFSRIDIYAALLQLDDISPDVNLIYPYDKFYDNTTTKEFIFNISDWQLRNATFYLWRQNGSLINETTFELNNTEQQINLTIGPLDFGIYYWNVLSFDENNNYAYAENNFTITTIINNLSNPLNNSYVNYNISDFNCEFNSLDELINSTFFIWKEGILLNNFSRNISGTQNNSEFSFNFTEEGIYNWNCLVYNTKSEFSFAEYNFSLNYDITMPSLDNLSISVSTTTATINFDLTEETNSSINISQMQKINESYRLNHSLTFSELSPSTNYVYNITFCDRANNCNFSSGSFTTSAQQTITSSGGGGGGGGNAKNEILNLQTTQNIGLFNGQKTSFSFSNGKNHTITLNKIQNNTVNLTLRSEPINLILNIGEEKKINLTNKEYYDLYLKLENITLNKANITIKEIQEPIYNQTKQKEGNISGRENEIFDLDEKEKKEFKVILILISMVILGILIKKFFLKKTNGKKEKIETKTKCKR